MALSFNLTAKCAKDSQSRPYFLLISQRDPFGAKIVPKVLATPLPMPIRRIPLEGHPFGEDPRDSPKEAFGGCLSKGILRIGMGKFVNHNSKFVNL